jgi:hypothetical protein
MIDRVLASIRSPLQGIARDRSGERKTIVDTGFDFGALFIVVPGYELKSRELFPRTVKAVDFGERLQPSLTALLSHNPIGTPGSESIVESFIRRAHRLFSR